MILNASLTFMLLTLFSCKNILDVIPVSNNSVSLAEINLTDETLYFRAIISSEYNFDIVTEPAITRIEVLSAPAGVTVSQAGKLKWANPSLGNHNVGLKVTDIYSREKEITVTIKVNSFKVCLWDGSDGADFLTSTNWKFCEGLAPTEADWVCLPQDTEATISNDSKFQGFFECEGSDAGGELIVDPGVELRMKSADGKMFRSSVTLSGATPGCTTCIVSSDLRGLLNGQGNRSHDTYITNGATLTLGRGVTLGLYNHTYLFVGDGTTAGHLVADGGVTPSEFPRIGVTSYENGSSIHFVNDHWNAIVVEGVSSSEKSSVLIDGLVADKINDHHLNYYTLNFINHYSVKKLDNFHIVFPYDSGQDAVRFDNCSSLDLLDTNWTSHDYGFHGVTPRVSIATCDLGETITVEEIPTADGETNEVDPNDIVSWF